MDDDETHDAEEAVVEPPGVVAGMTREEREDEFFRLLQSCTVRQAAAAVALDWSHLYRKRREDAAFAKRWEDATRVDVSHLIVEAKRRAMRKSDRLMQFLLERLDPQFRPPRQDVNLSGGMSLQVTTGVPHTPVDDLL